ncbi:MULTISPECIES: glycosyltransferase family 4 protein [unclassified Cupriavidus]|uniref:glycosyltransferase family 4 protein n=1 Tax=unclassified Cupriavidus TaxID=2640874 RepID=UPI0010F77BCF|nr:MULTISPECIES: glycosyltransferase family 4 protein [unclassified Cupriavidus]MWL88196.1 glycosyltransferase [Cupriavidus sp. SW-Y-13]
MKASGHPTVCFLTGTLNAFAGAERMTAVIANALAERGYRVLILSLWDRASVFPLHPDIVHHSVFDIRPSFKRHYLTTVTQIRRFLRQLDVDVLVEVDTMLTLFTLPATLGLNVRRIAWEHCHFNEDLGKPARRFARRLAGMSAQAVVVLTERDKALWQAGLGRIRASLVAIPNPLPFPLPPPRLPDPGGDSRIVLAVGRLTSSKGFDVLLRAWASARRSMPGWQLRIVGEGECRHALEALAAELGITDGSVIFPGTTDDMPREYEAASLFCLSSRYEGFGLVLIEAMAYGLPVISTNCETGPKVLLCDQENSWVVPVEDTTALATALIKLSSPDAQPLRQNLSAKAHQTAAAFTLERIRESWLSLLEL